MGQEETTALGVGTRAKEAGGGGENNIEHILMWFLLMHHGMFNKTCFSCTKQGQKQWTLT